MSFSIQGVGKSACSTNTITRRDFIKCGVASAAALSLPEVIFASPYQTLRASPTPLIKEELITLGHGVFIKTNDLLNAKDKLFTEDFKSHVREHFWALDAASAAKDPRFIVTPKEI